MACPRSRRGLSRGLKFLYHLCELICGVFISVDGDSGCVDSLEREVGGCRVGFKCRQTMILCADVVCTFDHAISELSQLASGFDSHRLAGLIADLSK